MPGWMQAIARANPVNWAVQAGRAALADAGGLGAPSGSAAALCWRWRRLTVWLSTRTFRAYQKSV